MYRMILNKDVCGRIFDNLQEGLYLVDENRVIRYWNKAAENISGYQAEEVLGRPCSDNILTHVDKEGNNLCEGMCPLALTIADGKDRRADIFLHHKDGHRVPVTVRMNTLTDKSGKIIGGAELFTATNRVRTMERRIKELEAMALLDNLTGIANRSYIEKELLMRFEERRRFGVPFGILFMDIDHFKNINDTYGHDVGDRVLKSVADTLVANSRPFDLVGRWGGEEFLGIIRSVTGKQLEQLGDRLRLLVKSSYIMLKEDKLSVSISTGATLVREDDSRDTLLNRADMLLYASKRDGRNRLTMG